MKRNLNAGSTSMIMLIAMMVLLTMSLGIGALALTSMRRADRDTRSSKAFQASQAGLELGISRAVAALPANAGVFIPTSSNITTEIAQILPGCTATYLVQPLADPSYAWVTCTVTGNGFTKSVRSLIRDRNVGIWNNAIFAGTGASGQAINGNVDIRGSVHILGDGEEYSDLNGNGHWDPAEAFTDSNHNGVWDPGEPFVDTNNDGVRNSAEPYNDTNHNNVYDPPLTQTDINSSFSGTGNIGNNYTGMPVGLEAMVPPPPIVNSLETLNTEVRVKHGKISISGSATIGSPTDQDGGTSKGKVDGSFVNDGYTGNQGASSVFSDNGTSNSYDLGNIGLEFPLLSGLGAETYTDPTGTVWPDHESYLDAKSMVCPVTTITATTNSFSYGPDAKGNSITFVKAAGGNPALLTINGIIKFNSTLQVGAKDTIRYAGNGTLFSKADINVDGNFLPAAGLVFPTTTRVGMIAKGNMGLATGNGSAQLSMAGAFYAQGTIISKKQNQIAGTFVANFYDMGTNVPNIYQVPKLPYNMPPAMPGDKNYYSLQLQSWRERIITGP